MTATSRPYDAVSARWPLIITAPDEDVLTERLLAILQEHGGEYDGTERFVSE